MKVRITKTHQDAVIPSYAKEGDAGLDLTAVTVDLGVGGEYFEYDTGIAVEIPRGYVGLVFPRSSVTNKNLMLKNSVGVIDSGYRGSIKFRFHPTGARDRVNSMYKVGDRIGQLIIIPYPEIEFEEVDSLDDSERGEGGFGSTDA